jgi:predicted metal-binding membrane protein
MTAHAVNPHAESRLVPATAAACVLVAAAAGWVVLVRRMAGMDVSPGAGAGGLGSLGWFVITWLVMTAAMMLPGSAPAVVRVVRGQLGAAAAPAVGFVSAYGAVWLLAGLAGYACVQAVRALDVSALAWSSAGRYVAAAAVVGAGLYQFTPVKRRWLARCTAPDGHLPRPGISGAVGAGARHGVCCVACCWTLMVALYALGIMSITWMVVLTVLIAGERLVARASVAVAAVAAVLVVLGVGIAAGVGGVVSVPGLTIPPAGHPAGMGMGTGMGMGMSRHAVTSSAGRGSSQ